MQTQDVSPVSSRTQSSPEQIRKVAKEFESIFASLMLKAMRGTVGGNTLIPNSLGEDIYTGMLDEEYARQLAAGSSNGLSDLIVRQLEAEEKRSGDLQSLLNLRNANAPWTIDPRLLPNRADAAANPPASPAGLKVKIDKWRQLVDRASRLHGVDRNLISAVIAQESGGNNLAVSAKGAKGLMQLMDSTAADLGVTAPFSPWANVNGGTKYLRFLLDQFGGNERLALASYNAGPAAVLKYGSVPPYAETQEYVDSVLKLRRHFEELEAKEGP